MAAGAGTAGTAAAGDVGAAGMVAAGTVTIRLHLRQPARYISLARTHLRKSWIRWTKQVDRKGGVTPSSAKPRSARPSRSALRIS